ncbi:MAG: DNA adenine methylase [Planctomycetes bacterium]|nr:DNA adenine methylase [Planctomycetota bacterium]
MAKSDDMPIKAICPWFGGKRNLAPLIVAELGPHRIYWGLCCGSMPELLLKPPCVMESVVDLHGDLTNLARVLAVPKLACRLYRRARRVLMSDVCFEDSIAVIRSGPFDSDAPDLDRAFHYLLTAWLGRNGAAGTASYNSHFCVRYTANGGHAAKRWDSVKVSIPAWHKRLRNVTILRRDVFDILPKIDDAPGIAIYCDPPYLVKGAKYLHDFDEGDHEKLSKAIGRFRHARVVVSYYDHPMLAELYPPDRWSRVCIEVSKAMAHGGQRGKSQATAVEVLLINGPSFTAENFSSPKMPLLAGSGVAEK